MFSYYLRNSALSLEINITYLSIIKITFSNRKIGTYLSITKHVEVQ